MLVSTLVIITFTLALAFAQPISEALVDLFALGLGDWDPIREARVATATRTLAVISFWILDFALNALQASGRALVLDRLNGDEMDSGNAWLGRSKSDPRSLCLISIIADPALVNDLSSDSCRQHPRLLCWVP